MKRAYADLHLCPDLRSPEQTLHMIRKAAELGYNSIAITLPANASENQIDQLRSIGEDAKIDVATRADLRPRTPSELLSNLRKIRRKFEVIAVACESKNVARQAAKDRRVDLLNFPSADYRQRFFDLAEAELAAGSLTALEVDAKPLLTLEGPAMVRLLSSLRRETTTALGFRVPIVLSSGASDVLLMRKPTGFVALASLFDLDKNTATDAISTNPLAIVKRNREKLSSRFVAPGIHVVRRGKDC
jgi:RNase P/RNase MRP subunit p30